jgi:hypothetical protein
LIPAGFTWRSARYYAFLWALVRPGAYFKAQNGLNHLIRADDCDERIEPRIELHGPLVRPDDFSLWPRSDLADARMRWQSQLAKWAIG